VLISIDSIESIMEDQFLNHNKSNVILHTFIVSQAVKVVFYIEYMDNL